MTQSKATLIEIASNSSTDDNFYLYTNLSHEQIWSALQDLVKIDRVVDDIANQTYYDQLVKAYPNHIIEFYQPCDLGLIELHQPLPPISISAWRDGDKVEGEKYARKCDITGEGMNEGWVVNGCEVYIKHESDAIEYCKTHWNQTLDEAYEDNEWGTDGFYWTSWEDQDDYQYIVKNGALIDFDESDSEPTSTIISVSDVMLVANSIYVSLTDEQAKVVIAQYSEADDSTSNWSEIVENIIHRIASEPTPPSTTTPPPSEDVRVWSFVEAFYPRYSSCDNIAYNNDLQVIFDNEVEEGTSAERILREECDGQRDVALNLLWQSNSDIYHRAIETFMKQRTYVLYGSDIVHLAQNGADAKVIAEKLIEFGNWEGALKVFTWKDSPTDIISETCGWGDYMILEEAKYHEIKHHLAPPTDTPSDSIATPDREVKDNAFGVYRVIKQIEDKYPELEDDLMWEKASHLYNQFLASSFNDPNEHEASCISKFLESRDY
jgi:hypothetical protein